MNSYLKNQYKQYLIEYLQKEYNLKLDNLKKSFKCPCCDTEDVATIYPNNITKFYCISPECSFEGDIFDLIRKTKNPKFKDEDVAHYLQHKFKIPIKDDIKDLLRLYEKNNFCMFPLEPNSKDPQKGFMWTEKEYKNAQVWHDWIDRGYGLALRLGKVSKVIAIDIDDDKTYEKIKDLMREDTLIQITKRGKHWLFIYEEDFDFIKHINLRNKGYDMEIRANNAYIAVAPTSANGEIRKWNNKKIRKMSPKLKKFLLELIDKNTKNIEEEIQESITKNELGIKNGLTGLDGECNDTFIKLGGILRKQMSIDQTRYALSHFNQLLANPMDKKSINSMVRQLSKYKTYDNEELAEEVIKRLDTIKVATAFQIAGSLRKEQKDIEDVLKYLEDQNKVIHLGNRKYQLVQDVEWTTEKTDMSVPVDFQVPYFHDYNYFDWGNMVIIGGASGVGKTHITGNIIKKLVDQGIKPYLITTEAGSKIGKITHKLGIPDESYLVPKKLVKHPMDIELVDNAITIIDWLKVKDSDYAKTDSTYEHFHEQLKKHKGFLIILTQLRKSNNEFFAMDQVEFYGACVAKYLFGNNGTDAENTSFQIQKLRDSRTGQQYITIPIHFDKDTKLLEIRK
jgi:hypothetical protein